MPLSSATDGVELSFVRNAASRSSVLSGVRGGWSILLAKRLAVRRCYLESGDGAYYWLNG